MARKRRKNRKKSRINEKKPLSFILPEKIKRLALSILMFLFGIIFVLSFFNKAGIAGKYIISFFTSLIGKTIFFLPLIFVLMGFVFLYTRYKKFLVALFIASILLVLGISGILDCLKPGTKYGGYFGYVGGPLLKLFGFWVSEIIFFGLTLIGIIIFWQLLMPERILKKEEEVKREKSLVGRLVKKVVRGVPSFKVKEVPESYQKKKEVTQKPPPPPLELKTKSITVSKIGKYQLPPIELLEPDKGTPSVGDIRQNSAIIRKTLESFGIPVEMSEVNIGPTVTQYTLKPAEGIKLSKITTLSNDLALALASHPIRIEAPIPGKSLVGIEVPNKVRTLVRLRSLIQNPLFQQSGSILTFCLGRDVSGNPVYADLDKMPHLLVAGATGTGKTIFRNSLIISLLYRNSPEILRFILVDPKRVEFPIYDGLPHLNRVPVIFDAQKTVTILQELTKEMERRFEILAEAKARDISIYNDQAYRNGISPLPYIVLIIDELADLMAARGREVEAGIVRLAQMARAVGIHLVVATQRPSVEVITGLIKANITSRITFQVASQIDSRTVIDTAGAEKLLGLGDMLFISAEVVKPKRIQGAYVSDKEVKKVVNWIKSNFKGDISEDILSENLEKALEASEPELKEFAFEEDPLYEDAKKIVIEARKASASLLQRKLRIGYARAARLIDMLEERGVVGPSRGAKPREVYLGNEEEGWEKI